VLVRPWELDAGPGNQTRHDHDHDFDHALLARERVADADYSTRVVADYSTTTMVRPWVLVSLPGNQTRHALARVADHMLLMLARVVADYSTMVRPWVLVAAVAAAVAAVVVVAEERNQTRHDHVLARIAESDSTTMVRPWELIARHPLRKKHGEILPPRVAGLWGMPVFAAYHV
jgi:hypothetical protein